MFNTETLTNFQYMIVTQDHSNIMQFNFDLHFRLEQLINILNEKELYITHQNNYLENAKKCNKGIENFPINQSLFIDSINSLHMQNTIPKEKKAIHKTPSIQSMLEDKYMWI